MSETFERDSSSSPDKESLQGTVDFEEIEIVSVPEEQPKGCLYCCDQVLFCLLDSCARLID
jgi:hypothetical protein